MKWNGIECAVVFSVRRRSVVWCANEWYGTVNVVGDLGRVGYGVVNKGKSSVLYTVVFCGVTRSSFVSVL